MGQYEALFNKRFAIVDDDSVRLKPFEIKSIYMDERGSSVGINSFYSFLTNKKEIKKINNQYTGICEKSVFKQMNDSDDENPFSVNYDEEIKFKKNIQEEKLRLKQEKIELMKQQAITNLKQIEEERQFKIELQKKFIESQQDFLLSLEDKIKELTEVYTKLANLKVKDKKSYDNQ